MGQHLADYQPIEQHADRGELLLHVRRRVGLLAALYIGRHVDRPDGAECAPPCLTPSEELGAGARASNGFNVRLAYTASGASGYLSQSLTARLTYAF